MPAEVGWVARQDSVLVEDQDNALTFYTEVLGFQKKTDIAMGDTVLAVFDDTCGNLIQIFQAH